MAITPLPPAPSRDMDSDAFNTAVAAFLAAMPGFATELQAALGWTTIGTLTTTSGTTQDFTGIPATYNDLLVLLLGVSFTTAVNINMALGNAPTVFATAQAVTASAAAAADTFYGGIIIPGYNLGGGTYLGGGTPLSADLTTGAPGALARDWRVAGGIKSLRFSGGTFDAGSIVLRGRQ